MMDVVLYVLRPDSLIYLLVGTILGYFVGVLPGIGPLTGIALLLPLTFQLSPRHALLVFTSLYQAAEYSGSITAIAVSTPGAPNSAATILDGYAMHRAGRIGKAFAYSLWSAVFGSCVGIAAMILLSRPLATLALQFTPVDFSALAIFGLASVGMLSAGIPEKGLLSVFAGLLVGTVGIDHISGAFRFTFGEPFLYNGIPLVALLTGLFALPEAVDMLSDPERKRLAGTVGDTADRIWLTWREFRAVFKAVCIGTVVGLFMGLIPGLAGSVPPWISYNITRSLSREPEKFGTGVPDGIVAPEATNATVMHTTLITAFSLGIPGTPTSAVILAAMIISGLVPGPLLFTEHPAIPYTVFVGLVVSTAMLWVIGLITTNVWMRIVRLPSEALAVAIILFTVIGSYMVRSNLSDVLVTFVSGLIGYLMRRGGYSAPALVLGVILGPLLEINARRALLLSGGDVSVFFTSPLSMVFLAAAVGVGLFGFSRARAASKAPTQRR
jgi:putative tricarboxylic transport membrane protein